MSGELIRLGLGFALLLAGGEVLVRGSVAVAKRLGVSTLVIGLTLVGFGTSTPELVASLQAALMGSPGIALGNVAGSNIANTFLILGAAALVLPVVASAHSLRRDGSHLLLATALLTAAMLGGVIERWMGAAGLLLLVLYTVQAYRAGRRDATDLSARVGQEVLGHHQPPAGLGLTAGLLLAAAGIAGVVFGAKLLVEASIVLAQSAGISETVIGLTLVALGTSLPEMAASLIAALRGHGDVAYGNIVGSNLFNILGIAGTTAVIRPVAVPPEMVRFDVWVLLASACLLVLFAATGGRIGRREGLALLALYGGFMAVQFTPALRALLGLA